MCLELLPVELGGAPLVMYVEAFPSLGLPLDTPDTRHLGQAVVSTVFSLTQATDQ